MWLFAIMLALVPTVISLVTMTMAVHAIGSTPTAIMGALEPLTAVIIGVTVFGEIFTLRLGIGIFMILVAVILIVAAKSLSPRKIVSFIRTCCCILFRYAGSSRLFRDNSANSTKCFKNSSLLNISG